MRQRKSSCQQSLLFVWTETQRQVKISVSFLILVQEKPGGLETQITVIKKNTWQRNMDATCKCAIVSNLENFAKRLEVQQYGDLKQTKNGC